VTPWAHRAASASPTALFFSILERVRAREDSARSARDATWEKPRLYLSSALLAVRIASLPGLAMTPSSPGCCGAVIRRKRFATPFPQERAATITDGGERQQYSQRPAHAK
jgi:hypothetical protein